jgi:dihydropteroate synthase
MSSTFAHTIPRRFSLALTGGRRLELEAGRPRLLGVVNITPDSFSDGGRFLLPDRAVEHALRLLDEGAELLDLGAESTRPGGGVYGAGAAAVAADEELRRLLPVLERLRAVTQAPISVDTRKSAVAERALAAGADLVNDIGALRDPAMREVVARAGCPAILMHSRGELGGMQSDPRYDDVVAEVRGELAAAMTAAEGAGIARSQLLVDPGLGFAKSAAHSLRLLASLDALGALGAPVVLGASRKSFLGQLTGDAVDRRLAASLAAAAWAASAGAALVRVHDVAETRQLLAVWRALAESREGAA